MTLRFTAHRQLVPRETQALSGTTPSFIGRFAVKMAKFPSNTMKMMLNNFYFKVGVGETNTGNAVVIDNLYLERSSTSVQVLFSGLGSVTLANGDSEILSDAISPTSFSLTEWPGDDGMWGRVEGHLAAPGNIPVGRSRTEETGTQAFMYDAATTSLVNGASGTGAFTTNNGGETNTSFGFSPLIVGTYSSADPPCAIVACDSHGEGVGSRTVPYSDGKPGFVCNALIDSDGASNAYALCQVGSPGASVEDFLTPNPVKWQAFIAYANIFISELGGNQSATSAFSSLWTVARNGGVSAIIQTHVLPQTTSTDSWATEAGQTADVSINPDIAATNTFLIARFTDSTVEYYCPIKSARGLLDHDKWYVTGAAFGATLDGDHMASAQNSLTGRAATEFRASWAAIVNGTPVLKSQSVDTITTSTAIASVTTNQATGTLYVVVVPDGDQIPTAAEIKAGQRSGGNAALFASSKAITAAGVQTFTITGLSTATNYDVYFIHNNDVLLEADSLTAILEADGVTPILTV